MSASQFHLLIGIALPAFVCGGFSMLALAELLLRLFPQEKVPEPVDSSEAARHRLQRAIEEVEMLGWNRAW